MIKDTITFRGIDFEVEYIHHEEEPCVMYYPDGSGHPGEPEYVELQTIKIEEVDIYEAFDTSTIELIEEQILNDL